MRVSLALIRLRLRQARAGRLPWLALVQIVLVGAVVLLAPAPTAEGRVRLALGAAITIAGLIAVVGGVAFGASLLPDDRESRRSHRLLAAPVSRGALGASSVLAAMLTAVGLALLLAVVSLPVIHLAGDAETREATLASTLRIAPESIRAEVERRESEGLVWLYAGNPSVSWEVALDPADLPPGDVEGRVRIRRRLVRGGMLKRNVRVGITVADGEESTVLRRPDRPVRFIVPEATARTGRFTVRLRRIDPSYSLGVARESLEVDGRRRSYLPEYGLAAFGAGLVAALLAAIATALGAIASAGVALATALSVGLVATLRDVLVMAARSVREGPGHHHGGATGPSGLEVLASHVVEGICAVAPDLEALGLGGPLRDGSTASLSGLLPGLGGLAIAVILAIALSWLFLRARENP